MNKLEIKNLNKRFGVKKATDDITITLENGVYGLLGPNGSGKTTLMKQITTLLTPDSGEIIFNGKNVKENEDEYRGYIGYLPQDFEAYKNFSAKEFLSYMAALKGLDKGQAKDKIDELLHLVGLYDVRNKKVGKFSGGMKRRVGIAQVLLNDPKIMVLDEPTAGLDPQERSRFRNLIADISRDKIIILSTHIISDIESVAKETIMIKNGALLMQGTHEDILRGMKNRVYVIRTKDEREIAQIQQKYKIVNFQRGIDHTEVRVVSETIPSFKDVDIATPKFEDVYMFYFDLEDTKEV
ncbi:ABC transporter ATP-binding protein [Clostridium botulinum]|nr:ABC transporter ATP-binding protein [Clostridium botulinum]MBO0576472.1 ABC transporter ATP-binding protein [Clostridium botulinum]